MNDKIFQILEMLEVLSKITTKWALKSFKYTYEMKCIYILKEKKRIVRYFMKKKFINFSHFLRKKFLKNLRISLMNCKVFFS